MATLSDIRTQVYQLLRETSGSDTNFTDAQVNRNINLAYKYLGGLIEQPRKFSSGTQVVVGTGNYSTPSDFILLLTAYFGDESLSGDSRPLRFVTEQTLKQLFPSWRDTSSNNYGRPNYIMFLDDDTFFIYPRPSAAESITGKKLIYNYVFEPVDMTSDSESPDLPLPFHNVIQFYAAHLCFLNLNNASLATVTFKLFDEHFKKLQSISTKESNESLGFQWGYSDDVNDDIGVGIIP